MGTRHLRAIVLLPFVMTVMIPLALIVTQGSNLLWAAQVPLSLLLLVPGIAFILVGLWLFYQTVKLFATVGQGTLAPWDAPQKLVAVGIYRHVRNPMISGVFAVLLGETLLSGSRALLVWSATFITVNLIYIPLLEEPTLERRFGDSYREYKLHVPRWLPRRTAWEQPGDQ